jgi:hypothetical protein
METDFDGGVGMDYFGHFKDLVSIHSDNKEYFRLGLAEEHARKTKATFASGMLFTFKDKDGMPDVSRFTCSSGET